MSYSEIEVKTAHPTQFINVTAYVRDILSKSGVLDGMCLVYVPHTTAGIIINEAADPAVARDIMMMLGKLSPRRDDYEHGEGNSHAHIKASLVGASVQIPVAGGKLMLGTWQGIFFCEFDGPRRRSLSIKIIGT
jgi:secondary thiamine-phosphate synthase enzyme